MAGRAYSTYDKSTNQGSFKVRTLKKPTTKVLKNILEKVNKMQLVVGFDNEEDATKAYLNEFGFITGAESAFPNKQVPPRPFLKPAIESSKESISGILRIGLEDSIESKRMTPINKAYENAGEIAVRAIKNEIRNGQFAPLSEVTVKLRRNRGNASTKPLIDTGSMIESVGYEVRKK